MRLASLLTLNRLDEVATSYQIPNQFLTKKWFSDTPEDFRFTAKFPGKITHEHKLKNVKFLVLEFLSALIPLKSQIFALVFQLPPSLSFDEARPHLDELFSYLPDYYTSTRERIQA